jgi:hypothetical protein
MHIQPDMKLGIKTVKRGYAGYIRGTQPYDIQYRDVRIFLLDSHNKLIMPIKKFKTPESALAEQKDLESLLGLKIADPAAKS